MAPNKISKLLFLLKWDQEKKYQCKVVPKWSMSNELFVQITSFLIYWLCFLFLAISFFSIWYIGKMRNIKLSNNHKELKIFTEEESVNEEKSRMDSANIVNN